MLRRSRSFSPSPSRTAALPVTRPLPPALWLPLRRSPQAPPQPPAPPHHLVGSRSRSPQARARSPASRHRLAPSRRRSPGARTAHPRSRSSRREAAPPPRTVASPRRAPLPGLPPAPRGRPPRRRPGPRRPRRRPSGVASRDARAAWLRYQGGGSSASIRPCGTPFVSSSRSRASSPLASNPRSGVNATPCSRPRRASLQGRFARRRTAAFAFFFTAFFRLAFFLAAFLGRGSVSTATKRASATCPQISARTE